MEFTQVLVKQLEALQNAPGDVCIGYALGRNPEASQNAAASYFSPELRQEELEAMADVLDTADVGRPMPIETALAPLLDKVRQITYAQIGDDAFALNKLNDPDVDPVVACRAIGAFYSAILSMPEGDRLIALRGVFAPD